MNEPDKQWYLPKAKPNDSVMRNLELLEENMEQLLGLRERNMTY